MTKLGGLPEDEARGFLINPLYDYFELYPEDKIKSKVKKIDSAEDDDTSEGIENGEDS